MFQEWKHKVKALHIKGQLLKQAHTLQGARKLWRSVKRSAQVLGILEEPQDPLFLVRKLFDQLVPKFIRVAGQGVVVCIAQVAFDVRLNRSFGMIRAYCVENAGYQSVGATLVEPMYGTVKPEFLPAETGQIATWSSVHLKNPDLESSTGK